MSRWVEVYKRSLIAYDYQGLSSQYDVKNFQDFSGDLQEIKYIPLKDLKKDN